MGQKAKMPSSWVYPDRDAWEKLLQIRPKPRPVLEKPAWWRTPWPPRRPGRAGEADLPNERKLDLLRNELGWARRCFRYAGSVLPPSRAKAKASRIADALARARKSFDRPEKTKDMDPVSDELVAVGRYDPARHARAFVEASGRSISAAGQVMAAAAFGDVAYWGRVLVRAGGFFRAMKHELPGEQAAG